MSCEEATCPHCFEPTGGRVCGLCKVALLQISMQTHTRMRLQLLGWEPHQGLVCPVNECFNEGSVRMLGEGRDQGACIWVCTEHVEHAQRAGYSLGGPLHFRHKYFCQAKRCGDRPTAYVELRHSRSQAVLGEGWFWLCASHCRIEGYSV